MEQTMIQYPGDLQPFGELALSFALKELRGGREERDRDPRAFARDGVTARAAELGFFDMNVPGQWGGSASGAGALAAVCGEISRVDASLAAFIFTTAAAFEVIGAASEGADCAALYEKIIEGGPAPVAFQSFTHPGEAAYPSARRDGERWLIRGVTRNLVLGGAAACAVVAAVNGAEGFSYYLVRLDDDGAVAEHVPGTGFRACPVADVRFTDAAALPVGTPGGGKALFRSMSSRMAVAAAAIQLGILRGSFDEARAYAAERCQGGRTIIDWPEVSMMLAGMALDVELGNACLVEAIRRVHEGGTGAGATALALDLGERACHATTDGVQLLGGNGYMSDYGQEKRMRDARMARQLLGMTALRKLEFFNERWRNA